MNFQIILILLHFFCLLKIDNFKPYLPSSTENVCLNDYLIEPSVHSLNFTQPAVKIASQIELERSWLVKVNESC